MIIPPGFGQITHFFEGSGLPRGAAVTHGIQLEGIKFGEIRVAEIADAWDDTFMGALNSSYRLVLTRLKEGPNTTGPAYDHVSDIPGRATNSGVPANVAVLIRKKTSFGGRSGKGRMYVPGVNEASVGESGVLTSGEQTNFQLRASDYLAALAALDSPMVLLSSVSSDPKTVNTLEVDSRVATQRRRLRR